MLGRDYKGLGRNTICSLFFLVQLTYCFCSKNATLSLTGCVTCPRQFVLCMNSFSSYWSMLFQFVRLVKKELSNARWVPPRPGKIKLFLNRWDPAAYWGELDHTHLSLICMGSMASSRWKSEGRSSLDCKKWGFVLVLTGDIDLPLFAVFLTSQGYRHFSQ